MFRVLSTQLLSTSHHQVTTHNCRGNLVSAVSYTECVLVLFYQTSIFGTSSLCIQPPNIRSSISVLVCVFACVYRYGGSNGGDRLPQRSEQVSDLRPGSGAGPGLPPRSGLEGQLWLQPGFPGCSGSELASEGGPGEGCVLDSFHHSSTK